MDDKPLMLDNLDGYQFEELIARIMKKKGYEKIKVTPKSRDVGKDIIMESPEGELILVECKHQNDVGRPVIQKLQGAINHEEEKHPNKEVKGIIVTSGTFSKEAIRYNKEIGNDIELIDGKKLKVLSEELDIVILNGKVQILTNKSFKNIDGNESKEIVKRSFSKIYGSKKHILSIISDKMFYPACLIKYDVNFDTHTSVGCIDSYSDSGTIVVDGVTGEDLGEAETEFFFSGKLETENIEESDAKKRTLFEFTENDIEDHAFNHIIEEHSHEVSYTGSNNVTYSKNCVPSMKDIDIKYFLPVYLPLWTNEITIMKQKYRQEFYVKGKGQLYIEDDLKKCKICDSIQDEYEDMSICPECGRIVCHAHVKIDHLDKETPICEKHAKPFQLWIQTKYFANETNLKEYKAWWESQGFFGKLSEDGIALALVICGVVFLFFLFIIGLSAH